MSMPDESPRFGQPGNEICTMTPFTRSVPQRRRRNLWPLISDAAIVVLAFMPLVIAIIGHLPDTQPSRLQPALDQLGRFGERKCWSGEVVR